MRTLDRLVIAMALGCRQSQAAARLFGALEGFRNNVGWRLPSVERSTYDKSTAAAREAVGDDEMFDALWQEGRLMTIAQAVEYALATIPGGDE